MAEAIPLYLWSTIVVWVVLTLVSLLKMRGQKIEEIKTNLLKATVLAMSTSIAVTLAGSVIFFVVIFQAQSAEIPDAFKLAALLGSAVLVIWTASTFWSEIEYSNSKQKQVPRAFNETRREVAIPQPIETTTKVSMFQAKQIALDYVEQDKKHKLAAVDTVELTAENRWRVLGHWYSFGGLFGPKIRFEIMIDTETGAVVKSEYGGGLEELFGGQTS